MNSIFSSFPLGFFVLFLLLWLCDVCDLESHCATHIQMLFKSVSAHLHVKLRIWSQVVCILISGTIFSKVAALKWQMNGTWLVSAIAMARHQLTYCTLILLNSPSPSSSNYFKTCLDVFDGQCSYCLYMETTLAQFGTNSLATHLWFIFDGYKV